MGGSAGSHFHGHHATLPVLVLFNCQGKIYNDKYTLENFYESLTHRIDQTICQVENKKNRSMFSL